jgi:hypothetical protein
MKLKYGPGSDLADEAIITQPQGTNFSPIQANPSLDVMGEMQSPSQHNFTPTC